MVAGTNGYLPFEASAPPAVVSGVRTAGVTAAMSATARDPAAGARLKLFGGQCTVEQQG